MPSAAVNMSLCVPVYRKHGPPNVATLAAEMADALDGLTGELVVVLNGISADAAGLADIKPAVTLPRNAGVPAAWNLAAKHARGDVLCFVNDDVRLGSQALRLLWEALQGHPDAGVVGPVGTRWNIRAATHLEYVDLKGLAPGQVRECDVVSGFLFATPRNVYRASGGFDEAYTPCGWEEIDYCTTTRIVLGRRCFAVSGVDEEHQFRISAQPLWRRVRFNGRSESLRSINRRNRQHFMGKWSDHGPSTESVR